MSKDEASYGDWSIVVSGKSQKGEKWEPMDGYELVKVGRSRIKSSETEDFINIRSLIGPGLMFAPVLLSSFRTEDHPVFDRSWLVLPWSDS